MKKLLILLPFLLFSCVNTTPKAGEIGELKHSTIELAKQKQADSLVIVSENYQDYVFKKEKNGELTLVKKYISSEEWMDIPWAAFLIILIIVGFVSWIFGKVSY